MLLTIHNRALLRGMLAGAVALGGISACSRSDRADAGRDTTQTGAAVTPADTQASTAPQTAAGDTALAPSRETTTAAPQMATPQPEPQPARPTAEAKDSAAETGDQPVSGYQAMGHDTSAAAGNVDSTAVSAEVGQTTDTSVSPTPGDTTETEVAGAATDTTTRETVNAADSTAAVAMGDSMPSDHAMADTAAEVSTDTTTAGYEPMARDTSTVLAQSDTAAQAEADTVATPTEPIRPPEDSTEVYGQAPEDSTEVLGNVTPERNDDVEAVGDANADQAAAGAAPVQSTGNIATGAEAVALMSRAGQPCRVEDSRDAAWDLASSPGTLNPCGTGTMTLPKVQTGEEK
jgi:hypothetical protein